MDSVTVRIRAAEFSATMTEISEWLDANRYQPIRYRYDHHEDAVLVTVDFPAKAEAEAFATRFDGAYHLSPRPVWPDSPSHLPAQNDHSAWFCVIFLAVLSFLPAQNMVRTGLPGRVEHFIAYAGSAAIAMAGYGAIRGTTQIIGGFRVYAGILAYLQHFSLGRHPALGDFAASALGALCGGFVIALGWRRWPA